MEFSQLYQFVGPPMTRGPPPLPLALLPRSPLTSMTSPFRAFPVSPFPPPLPSPSLTSRFKRHTQRLKPHHHLKPRHNGLPRHFKPSYAQTSSRATIRSQLPPLVPETFFSRVPEASVLGHEDVVSGSFGWCYDDARLSGGYDQVSPEEAVDFDRADAREVRVKMSEIEYEHRGPHSDAMSSTASDEDICGEPSSIWASVLDMYPQCFALDVCSNAA